MTDDRQDAVWMAHALELGRGAMAHGDVPIGAVVVRDGALIGSGANRREVDGDPLAHAELLAIASAAEVVGGWRLTGATMYVTLEPCAMCAGALVNSRIDRLVFAAADPKAGFCGSLGNLVEDPRLNHRLTVRRGIMGEASGRMLRGFFADLRRRGARDEDRSLGILDRTGD